MRQTVSVETAANPDVLTRVTMLLGRGNLSIVGMNAEHKGKHFHMCLELSAETEYQFRRFVRQAEKLVDVYAVALSIPKVSSMDTTN
ncbi:hypothetical protein M3N64_08635 [Sporolactobacillus sp. CPB3-1]|uniref:ACT domain-containing protein n=1 Tax=Sporolactobacillus mangiferae TaxID=2940498 RepID=A0ABT0MCL5_9BACL|nr:hypothetical protein [Sporolactobacillus mangiferae]MCL1632014.1 hypothetical protein [Sporolactobacillus mangiferae]